MTADPRTLPAGAELDRLTCEAVGIAEIRTSIVINDVPTPLRGYPPVSTDPRAAWRVVEAMQERGWSFSIFGTTPISSVMNTVVVGFSQGVHPPTLTDREGRWNDRAFWGWGEPGNYNPALPICRAALAALAGREERTNNDEHA